MAIPSLKALSAAVIQKEVPTEEQIKRLPGELKDYCDVFHKYLNNPSALFIPNNIIADKIDDSMLIDLLNITHKPSVEII